MSLPAAPVALGSVAPDFTLPDQHRAPVRLSDLRGRTVVLVFFPFAFTSVCTGELCAMRDDFAAFDRPDVVLLAVSCDAVPTLRTLADREELPFPLLSDFWPHGEVSRAYGVFDEDSGFAMRGTFVIDAEGVVRWTVLHAMPDARDLEAYKRAIDDLAA